MSVQRVMTVILLLVSLIGCGDAAPLPPTSVQHSATVTIPTPLPEFNLEATPMPTVIQVFDNMPIIGMGMDTTPKLDDQGILRSPVDNMPILPGDPNVAPMPNISCGDDCTITQTLELKRNNGQK